MKNNQDQQVITTKTSAKISGPLLFGLKLLSVEQVRKTMSLEIISKIRSFTELSNFTKRHKILGLLQHILDVIELEKKFISFKMI